MIDLNALLSQRLGQAKKTDFSQINPAETNSFESEFAAKLAELSEPKSSVAPAGSTSKLPPEILAFVQALIDGRPLTEDQLKKGSRMIQAVASGLVHMANQVVSEDQATQVNTDLDILITGSVKLLTNYAYKPAVKDIVKLIRSLDSRSDAYSTLEAQLTSLISSKSFELTGTEETAATGTEKATTTYDIQYSLWEALSVVKGDTQVQQILDLFDQYNQMVSAKVDIDDTPVDSLVDSGSLVEAETTATTTNVVS